MTGDKKKKVYLRSGTTIHISDKSRRELEKMGASGQKIHYVVDQLIENHYRLLDDLKELQMASKTANLPEELLTRLKKRQRPHQALAGVIEELLETVENLEKNQLTVPLNDRLNKS